MAERARVAAVVLNWRQCDATLSVWKDLRACGHALLRVLLIDNGSGDGSAQRLRLAVGDDAEVMAFDHNLGYCAAMNRSLDWAEGQGIEHVLFLNNDVRLPPGFLTPMVEALDHDPGLAGVGPTVLDPDGKVWCQGGAVRFGPNLSHLRGQGREPAPKTHGPELVDYLPGACALFRLADLRAVGGLDEDYFMYVEDVDLGCRLRAAGKKIIWLPWVSVVHEASLSSGGGRTPLRKYMSAVNTVRFLRAHGTARLWTAFLLFDCLLWPLTLVSGGGVGAAMAKGRGVVAGLFGRRLCAADVGRFIPEDGR